MENTTGVVTTVDIPLRRSSLALLALLVCLLSLSCSEPTQPITMVGAFTATTFRSTPDGQAAVDLLTQGGVLAITIAEDHSTTGTLTVPGSVTGGAPFVANMAGTATLTGDTVRFQQSANSFVRSQDWLLSGNTLHTVRSVDGATLTITLSR